MRAALALSLALLASPAVASDWGRPVDNGGLVSDYINALVDRAGARDEIRGDCVSACTIRLASRGACVYPDTTAWFHAASGPEGTRAMLVLYPPRLRAFVIQHGLLESRELRPVQGWQLIRLGIRAC